MNILRIMSGSGSIIEIEGSEEKVSVSRSMATMSSYRVTDQKGPAGLSG